MGGGGMGRSGRGGMGGGGKMSGGQRPMQGGELAAKPADFWIKYKLVKA